MNNVFKKRTFVLLSLVFFVISSCGIILAATSVQTTLNQTITAASLSIAIVDAAGDPVATPSVAFNSFSFSFNPGNSTGVLGTSTEKIRVSNPTATVAWAVSIAATGGDTAVWTDGGTNTYPYNDVTSADNGRLTVDATTSGVITPASGCSATSLSKGASATFVSGTLSSITILSATTGADTYCYWDLTSVGLSQRIPASQIPASYSLGMTLSVM